ncbi:hypothetical protein E2K93_00470 [Thalassotalea sp. HSM 43]|uniref:hypothetical protein n=1 Tax=Thalassotalea sp. HSM 43 TaxID=2552945 RepID=UPI00108119D0|nr:hypothetical protein [Thalassotalea sp. HSM 43]QBY02936.1 hypothetical protein E2K93_00470 [Thalassotalea sp. HSM 43]
MIKKYFVKLLSINLLLISFTSLADVQDDTNTAMLLKCNGGFGNISLNGSKPKYGHVGKNLKITAEETSSWDTAYAWFITSPSYFNSPLNKSDVEGVGDYLAQSGLFDQIEELTGDADEDEFTYSNFTRGGPWAVTIATIDVDFDWSWPPFGIRRF